MKVYQVSEFIDHINSLIASEVLGVEGEISGFNISQGRWVFFDLKDERDGAKIGCFMLAFRLKAELADGMRVKVLGIPKVHEKSGQFRVNVEAVELLGEGALKRAYELLLKKLEKEGLFDESRKRVIPKFPEVVGVIASKESAAYGDFMRILKNRWGGVAVELAHVRVQGDGAAEDIVRAFAYFNGCKEKPDALVLTRGGGSLEDLQAFNSEEVARAVFSSKVPVIVGVGHERDETIADFVADRRASTPSNAAEIIVPDRRDVAYVLSGMGESLQRSLGRVLDARVGILNEFAGVMQLFLREKMARLDGCISTLKTLDPRLVLKRGYALVRSDSGSIVKDAAAISIGATIAVQLARGTLKGKVIGKKL